MCFRGNSNCAQISVVRNEKSANTRTCVICVENNSFLVICDKSNIVYLHEQKEKRFDKKYFEISDWLNRIVLDCTLALLEIISTQWVTYNMQSTR